MFSPNKDLVTFILPWYLGPSLNSEYMYIKQNGTQFLCLNVDRKIIGIFIWNNRKIVNTGKRKQDEKIKAKEGGL